MKIPHEDHNIYRDAAIKILEDNGQHDVAAAVRMAFSAWGCVEQFRWERDIVLEMLEELGLGFAQKIDGVYLSKEEYGKLLEVVPTVYDIDNIIKQLEDNSLRANLNAFEFSMSKYAEPIIVDERSYGEFRAYETAINIVKGASDETD